MLMGGILLLALELCCQERSAFATTVPESVLCVGITELEDLTHRETKREIHALIELAKILDVKVHVWVSVPCTAGCRWRYINLRKNI